jgi:hypothetical protein
MSSTKIELSNTTSHSSIPASTYPENIQTFEAAPVILSTSGTSIPSIYGVFILDNKIRAGSYTVTSSQDAYRIINQNLLKKTVE